MAAPRRAPPRRLPGSAARSFETRLAFAGLAAVLLLGALYRSWMVVGDHSVHWPDEIHKSLEPAHRMAFGYGFRAWEFVRGAAHWTFAGLLGGLLAVLSWAGFDDPARYVVAVRTVLAACTLAAAWATMHLARRHGASALAGVAAAALVALPAPMVFFSHRALSETASLLPVAAGLALALPAGASRRATVIGTSLLCFAVLLRLQNVVFPAGLLIAAAARRDGASLRAAALTAAAWAALFGVVDWITWGAPFHSAVEYLEFNVFDGGASRFGTAPFAYYARFFAGATGPVGAVALSALILIAARRAPALLAVTVAFLVLHSITPHKEVRFILPAVPPLAALAGIGADVVGGWTRRRGAVVAALAGVVAAGAAASGAGVRDLRYGDVGQGHLFAPGASAYTHGDSVNRLLLAAHERRDLCGLKVEGEIVAFTGGYAYLHRPVPLYGRDGPPRETGAFNYVVGPWDPAAAGVVARDSGLALIRLGGGPCRPGPFEDRLSPELEE